MRATRRIGLGFSWAPLALALLCVVASRATAEPPAAAPHRIGHVFLIVLENEGFERTFGPGSQAPYLARALTRQGVLLSHYYATGHDSLSNYLAMISGQGATPETRDDCEIFADFTLTGTSSDGQAIGHGCVYPASVKTLADQLVANRQTWRAYLEDMGNDPGRETATCGHPPVNSKDPTQAAEPPSAAIPRGDQYAARHNPFVYFHSIIDSAACATQVVELAALSSDIATEATTPNFVFIAPNLCNDGHDAPCVDGQPGGLESADRFLQTWVPAILASPAYRMDGLLIITFDEGEPKEAKDPGGVHEYEYPGEHCCDQQSGPNLAPFPQSSLSEGVKYTYRDFGGERVGAVLLSPFLTPGTESATPFNHYSLLRTLEDIFGVGAYLGYAGQPGLNGFFGCDDCDITAEIRIGRPRP